MKLLRIVVLLCMVGLLAAGCNGEDDTDPAAEEADSPTDTTTDPADDIITVEALDNEFSPAEFEVPTGDVEITLDNTGQNPHTFTSEELGVDEEAPAGEQTTFTLSAEPGDYEFVCRFHEALGMVGTVTVAESAR